MITITDHGELRHAMKRDKGSKARGEKDKRQFRGESVHSAEVGKLA